MPVIAGRYYMNPAHGAEIERARQAEEGGRATREPLAESGRGKPVHRVEIECAEGGYVARIHRHAGDAAPRDEEGWSKPGEQPVAQPSVHVFTNHNDLVDFLREQLGPPEVEISEGQHAGDQR